MASNSAYDKLTKRRSIALLTTIPFKLDTYVKVDLDSLPAGRLAGIKVSVMDNSSSNDNVTYMFYASLDTGGLFTEARIIAHAAIGAGGGNCYLKVNRKIWSGEDGQVGGPVTVWAECSDNVDSTTVVTTAYTKRLLLS